MDVLRMCVYVLYCACLAKWTCLGIRVYILYVCELLEYPCATCAFVCVWVHTGGGISTQNDVRAVTSRAEIGLVSPVIRRRGERGKRRKLEERKRLFHHHYLPLHLHHNFISNSRHWMHNRTAMPLWSRLKLMEYLYADCGSLNFLSFSNSVQPPFYLSPISRSRIAFVRIWHYFCTSKSTVFPSATVEREGLNEWMWEGFGLVLLTSPHYAT